MVDLVELQALAYAAQIIGVVGTLTAAFIGVRSYITSNKRTQETRDMELETRQAQLFMQIYSKLIDSDYMKEGREILDEWKWTDLDDLESKYLNDRDNRGVFWASSDYFEGIGVLVKRKLIDPEVIDDLMSSGIIGFWEKFKPIVDGMRRNVGEAALLDMDELYGTLKEAAKNVVYPQDGFERHFSGMGKKQ